jgi:menaquinone-dependent protoporphyrinogen oxidase
MRALIVYGTTEGHTRDLCHFAAQSLRDHGHQAAVEEAGPDDTHPDPSAYDAVLLAASLHQGHYQAALVHFARTHHERLNGMPSAFISVSLSAAGINPDDWAGLETCIARLEDETLWMPKAVHHAAGAIRYSQYDFFKRLALNFIARRRGHSTVMSRDYDLTDYDELTKFVLEFVDGKRAESGEGKRPLDLSGSPSRP